MLVLLALPATAATLEVPGDHATVQAAVNAASPGDVVLVTSSVGGSVTIDKDLTLHGAGMYDVVLTGPTAPVLRIGGGAIVTVRHLVIDGGHARRAVEVLGSGTEAWLDHVVVRQGSIGEGGAGIRVRNDASVTVDRSLICDNEATGSNNHGGGVFVETRGTFTLTHSVVLDNRAPDDRGGGVRVTGPTVLTNNTFTGNRAETAGAAVYTYDATTTLTDNIVLGNDSNNFVVGMGGSSAYTGGHNLYFANGGNDVDDPFIDDLFVDPQLLADQVTCLDATLAHFTATTGGNADVQGVGAVGPDLDLDGWGEGAD